MRKKIIAAACLLTAFFKALASEKPDYLTTSSYIINEHGQYLYWTDKNTTKMYAAERESGSGCCTPTPPECHLDSNQEFNLTSFISDPSKLYEQHFSATEQKKMLGVEGEMFFNGIHLAYLMKREVKNCKKIEMKNDRKRKFSEGH